MATDPYHNFAADLRSSLSSAKELTRTYEELSRRRKGQGHDQQLSETYERLQDSLEALENDIGDVRESVQMVETRGPERFGVDPAELNRRKRFVQQCEEDLLSLSKAFRTARNDTDVESGLASSRNQGSRGYEDADADADEDEDATLAFEMEQQQQLMTKQDNTLDLIGNAMTSLRRQAGTLGQEIGEQVELIGALDSEVDASQNKLTRALGRMDELARRADDRMGGWCVWLLIIALMVFALIATII